MSPMLRVLDLEVRYGGVPAVRKLSFQVEEGEALVIIGANGAGKSSTLRALAGLVPSQGDIRFQGSGLQGLPAHARAGRGLALVPEGRGIFGSLTVRENLRLGGWNLDGEGMRRAQERVLELFPRLAERLSQAGGTLSGGEQQMLAVARALMGGPSMLLLDEPSMGLSPRLVGQVFSMLAGFRKEGLTLLVVEQNAALALDLADRACVLEAGELRLEGAACELKGHPGVLRAYLGGEESPS